MLTQQREEMVLGAPGETLTVLRNTSGGGEGARRAQLQTPEGHGVCDIIHRSKARSISGFLTIMPPAHRAMPNNVSICGIKEDFF